MKRIYAIEPWCLDCKRCEIACKTRHSASRETVKALCAEDPAPVARVRVEGATLAVENPVDADVAAALDPARLTDRFYQGDPSRTGQGSGLGLAVVGALAEAMGASFSVDVTREPPRFSARLELRPASEARAAS